ncbi:MAG: ATP-binding protein [Ignavibacteriae bacterium]|nr:ATP-binding protein [Ignavibacteriota bacterium]
MVAILNTHNNQISASGSTAELEKIREFVGAQALLFGFQEVDAFQIALAVDEACSNLIRHSYHNDNNRQFVVKIEQNNGELIIQVMDNGDSFNPMSVPEPDMEEYFKKFKRGGLGVQIMRKVMDKIEYLPAQTSTALNILSLTKRLA